MSVRTVQRRAGVRVCWVAGIALTLFATCVTAIADRQAIDLSEASIVSDRGDWGYHREAVQPLPDVILDGDPETVWNSCQWPLSWMPMNLFVTLPEPVEVGAMELVALRDSNGHLRLTDFEVYARVGEGWAFLGQVEGSEQELMELDLVPAEVQMLRVRLMRKSPTPAPDTWVRIQALRLFAPEVDARPVHLSPAQVPDETRNERVFIREALGLREREPRTAFDPEIGYLGYVTAFLDTMIEKGTDRYGEVHSPMFAGLLEIDTHEHPGGYLPTIPGQRWWDRAVWGANLAHDRPLLEAMQFVSDLTGDEKYRDAARAYLQFFLHNCTDTPTGLWPWGEHAYWDFYRDDYCRDGIFGSMVFQHELEGRGSIDFWETAWEMNPQAVLGLARGLINHVKDLETFVFCRHADIRHVLPDPRSEDLSALDFKGIGGYYVRIWAFAWSKTGDDTYYGWIERMADYFEDVRLAESGMLPVLSQYATTPALRPDERGTLSVGLSMLEASELLEGTELGERLRRQGTEYLELVAAAEPVTVATLPRIIERPSASGGKAVTFWESHGAWLDLTFDLPEAGAYLISVRYALGYNATRRVVLIDGEEVGEIELRATGSFSDFETVTLPLEPLNLPAGEVFVRLLNRHSTGLCLDWVALHGVDGTPRVVVEAQDASEMGIVEVPPAPIVVGFDSGYGGLMLGRQIPDRPITAFVGNHTQMLAYRVTGDERHLEAAREVAEAYAAIEEVPDYDHLRANIFGRLVHMMLDMYELYPDERWLEAAEMYGRAGIEGLYSNGLFRGATNQWIYDSHLGVSFFVHGLVRLHAVTEQEEVQVPPLHY